MRRNDNTVMRDEGVSDQSGCERKQLKVTTAINVSKRREKIKKVAHTHTHTKFISGNGFR